MAKPRIVVAPSLPADVFRSLPERFAAIGGDGNFTVEQTLQAAKDSQAEAILEHFRK